MKRFSAAPVTTLPSGTVGSVLKWKKPHCSPPVMP